ncbi:HNH endonuclease [Nocardioides litoris]|uniref:HNH endonuclease n=1 Tax=Nocardioides litoris TaxID=1926648 RepID=UPI003CCC7D9C
MDRAGGRCEESLLLAWGRCSRPAQEADHVCPWSRGGATMPSNGQALCRRCNRTKSDTRPAWWCVIGLERRRRHYFPAGSDVRVRGALDPVDRAVHRAAVGVSRGRSAPTARRP